MTQCNILNVKLSNSQVNKLKSGIRNVAWAVLNFSSNVIGNFNDKTNFSHKLSLTNLQVSRLPEVTADDSSAIIKNELESTV